MNSTYARVRGPVATILVGLVGIILFHREFFLSGGQWLQGGLADGRLTSFIATHWLDPWRWGSWQDLGMFYPLTETIGYSDWLLLHGLLSAPFALAGTGTELAFQWALITFTALAYTGMVVALRVGPRLPWLWCSVPAFVFAFGNNMFVAMEHPQLAPIALLPWLAALLIWACRAHGRWAALALSTGGGALLGLLLVSAFYVFWFVALASALGAVMVLLWPPLRRIVSTNLRQLAWILGGLALGVMPFLLWSAPVFLNALALGSGQRSEADILYWSLSPKDFINVSSGNFVWGWLITALYPEDLWWRSQPSEWAYAATPVFMLLVLLALLAAWKTRRKWQKWEYLALLAVIVGLLLLLALLRIGPFFPWAWISHLPGATAIRALGRLELVSTFLLAFGTPILLWRWFVARERPRWARVLLCVGAIALLVEQVNVFPMHNHDLSRYRVLEAIEAPPSSCRTFVITQPLISDDPSPPIQIDAMLISRMTGVKTLHGYTGIEPPGWNLTNPWESDYRARVLDRIDQFDAQDFTCGLDLAAGEWLTPTELTDYLTPE